MNTLKYALIGKPNQVDYTSDVIDHISRHIDQFPGYKSVFSKGHHGLFYKDKPIIPSNKIDQYLEKLYNDPSIGFTGRDKLYGKIKDRCYGISKRRVERFVAEKKSGKKVEKQIIRQPSGPSELWQLRLIHVEDRVVLVVQDEYSKLIMASPLNVNQSDIPEKFDQILSTPFRLRWIENQQHEDSLRHFIMIMARQLVDLEKLNAESKLDPVMVPVLETYREILTRDNPSLEDVKNAIMKYESRGKKEEDASVEEYSVEKPEAWKDVVGPVLTVMNVPPKLLLSHKDILTPRFIQLLTSHQIRHANLTANQDDTFMDKLEAAVSRYPLTITITEAVKRIVHDYNTTVNDETKQTPIDRHIGKEQEAEEKEAKETEAKEKEEEEEEEDDEEVEEEEEEKEEKRKIVIPRGEMQRRMIAAKYNKNKK